MNIPDKLLKTSKISIIGTSKNRNDFGRNIWFSIYIFRARESYALLLTPRTLILSISGLQEHLFHQLYASHETDHPRLRPCRPLFAARALKMSRHNSTLADLVKAKVVMLSRKPTPHPQQEIVVVGVMFLASFYFHLLSYLKTVADLPLSPPEYCDTDKPCSRPDLIAFQYTCFIPLALLGGLGFICMLRPAPATPTARMYSEQRYERLILSVSQSFQYWDFLMTIMVPFHRSAIMLAHHVLAFLVSYYGSRYTSLLYYGSFFCGASEVSSIGLCFVDLNNILGEYYSGSWVEAIKVYFVITFFIFRIALWMFSYMPKLFSDAMYVLELDTDVCRKGLGWQIRGFCVICLLLAALQLFWFGIIIKEVRSCEE